MRKQAKEKGQLNAENQKEYQRTEYSLAAGGSQEVEFVNDRTNLGSLSIQKNLQGAESGTFAFTVTKDGKYYSADGTVSVNVPLGGEDGTQPVTYYVYETDSSGVPVNKEAFAYEVSGEGSVTVSSADAQAVTITNTLKEEEEVTEESTEESAEGTGSSRTSSGSAGSVKTGDTTDAMTPLIGLIGAALVLADLIFIRRRQNLKKDKC